MERRVVEAVGRALARKPRVAAALVFGSRARGGARADSDIDVGILLDAAPSGPERASVIRELVEALAREVAADRVDVVLLNDAPPVLAFQVLKHGTVAVPPDGDWATRSRPAARCARPRRSGG